MNDPTAAVLTLIVISPSMIVLAILLGRGARDYWISLAPWRKLLRQKAARFSSPKWDLAYCRDNYTYRDTRCRLIDSKE